MSTIGRARAHRSINKNKRNMRPKAQKKNRKNVVMPRKYRSRFD